MGLRCIRVGWVLRQLALALKIYNRLRLVKRGPISSYAKMADRMASAYVLLRRSSVNRFDFLSSYRVFGLRQDVSKTEAFRDCDKSNR
ncbi:MAG: hypothetical protein ACKESB_01235 [Candidatus Hodgkinia cicadicola]